MHPAPRVEEPHGFRRADTLRLASAGCRSACADSGGRDVGTGVAGCSGRLVSRYTLCVERGWPIFLSITSRFTRATKRTPRNASHGESRSCSRETWLVRRSMRLSPRRPSERSTTGSRRAVAPAVWLPLTVRMQCGPQSRVCRALSRWMYRASAITQRPVCDRRELLSRGLAAHGAVRVEGMLVGAAQGLAADGQRLVGGGLGAVTADPALAECAEAAVVILPQ